MASRVDIDNINTSLLDAINNVRKGDNTSITIKYHYSNIENELPSSIHIIDFKKDVEMAFLQWKLCFNALYTPNKIITGDLNLNFEESSSSEGIKIRFSGTDYVSGGGNTIRLNPKIGWTASYTLKSNPLLSAMIYGIGRSLGLPTVNTNSPMSLQNAKMNYVALSSLSFENDYLQSNGLRNYTGLIKNILYVYGDVNNKNDIVYGCTNPNAENYNIKANRDDGSCSVVKSATKNNVVFSPKRGLKKSYKVLMSATGYGTLEFKNLSLNEPDTFNL